MVPPLDSQGSNRGQSGRASGSGNGEGVPATARNVLFVLPAFNEAASIQDLLRSIARVSEGEGYTWSALVVDDGSTDGTGDLASAMSPRLPVDVLRNDANSGLGHSIRRGLASAVSTASDGDVVVTMDADLTHDPVYVPAMLDRLDEGFDVVIASRYRRGSAVRGLGPVRRLLSRGASTLAMLAAHVPGVKDYSSGMRAYRIETLRWGFATFGDGFITEDGFGCMVEIAQRLRGQARFAEVPFVLAYDRKRKASAMKVLPTILAYFRVAASVRRDVRSRRTARG